jgi:hypothetical protein
VDQVTTERRIDSMSFLCFRLLTRAGFRLVVTLTRYMIKLSLKQKVTVRRTFRFVPFAFESVLPFPLASFFGDAFSFGFTEKNPSNRPCCLLFRNFCSLSAPFLTRSSLNKLLSLGKGIGQEGNAYLNPFSVTKNCTSPSTSGFFHSS